jgi:hypothetical protein
MKIRKFEITSITVEQSSPFNVYTIYYKGIRNKKWINGKLLCLAKSEKEAKDKMMKEFGGIL